MKQNPNNVRKLREAKLMSKAIKGQGSGVRSNREVNIISFYISRLTFHVSRKL